MLVGTSMQVRQQSPYPVHMSAEKIRPKLHVTCLITHAWQLVSNALGAERPWTYHMVNPLRDAICKWGQCFQCEASLEDTMDQCRSGDHHLLPYLIHTPVGYAWGANIFHHLPRLGLDFGSWLHVASARSAGPEVLEFAQHHKPLVGSCQGMLCLSNEWVGGRHHQLCCHFWSQIHGFAHGLI